MRNELSRGGSPGKQALGVASPSRSYPDPIPCLPRPRAPASSPGKETTAAGTGPATLGLPHLGLGYLSLSRPQRLCRAAPALVVEPGHLLMGTLLSQRGARDCRASVRSGQPACSQGQVATLTAAAVFPRSIWPAGRRTSLDWGKAVSRLW